MGIIKRIDWNPVRFRDVDGIERPLRGIALQDRGRYLDLRGQLDDLLAEATEPHPVALWNTNQRFKALCTNLLVLAGVLPEWAIAPKVRGQPQQQILWGLLLPYEVEGGRVCRGLIDEQEFAPSGLWEAATGEPAAKPQAVPQDERETIDALRFRDCQGKLHELTPLPAAGHKRMEALTDLLLSFEGTDLRAIYDAEPEFRAVLSDILSLWRLTPQQLTFGQVARLVFDCGGTMGWLRQLQYPPVTGERGEPLPLGEDAVDSVIALLMLENHSLLDALKAVSAVPYPQLQSILRSRGRMLEDAQAKRNGKRGAVKPDKTVPAEMSAKIDALLKRPPLAGRKVGAGDALGSQPQVKP